MQGTSATGSVEGNVTKLPQEGDNEPTTDTNIDSMLMNLDAQVLESKKALAQIQIGIRVVRRQAYVLSKLAAKAQRPKRKRAEGDPGKTRKSGFAAASVLSSALKEFMGLSLDEMRSRTEVTKWLCNYIQECNLQGTEDKRYIMFKTDKGLALQKLLNCEKSQITYFDLQYYLKFHISSKNNPMTAADTSTTTDTVTVPDIVSVTPTPSVTTTSTAPAVPVRKAAIRPRPVSSTG